MSCWYRAGGIGAVPSAVAKAHLTSTFLKRLTGPSPETLTEAEINQFRDAAKQDNVSEDISEELALVLALAQRIRANKISVPDAYPRLKFVFDCLLAMPPRLILAR